MQKKKVGHKVLNYTLGKVTLFSFEILLSFSFCTVKKRKKKECHFKISDMLWQGHSALVLIVDIVD